MGSLTKKMSGELSLRQVRQAALNKLDKVLREPPKTTKCALYRGKHPASFRECPAWPWPQTDKSGNVRAKHLRSAQPMSSATEKTPPAMLNKVNKETNKIEKEAHEEISHPSETPRGKKPPSEVNTTRTAKPDKEANKLKISRS
ncbi:hypothetical protein MTP99_013084 [Tenebrio molitor]|nr:hypothetical protein MTP99_013084 [Tenebrio molitor]